MNFDQLANLIKAGFNEEQIRSIGSIMDGGTLSGAARSRGTNTGTNTSTNTGTNTPAPTTTALQTPPATPAPTSAPETPPATTPATTTPPAESSGTLTSATQSGESETVTLLKEMLGIIQKGNINTVGTGAAPQETGVDVLAEILNPTPKTK